MERIKTDLYYLILNIKDIKQFTKIQTSSQPASCKLISSFNCYFLLKLFLRIYVRKPCCCMLAQRKLLNVHVGHCSLFHFTNMKKTWLCLLFRQSFFVFANQFAAHFCHQRKKIQFVNENGVPTFDSIKLLLGSNNHPRVSIVLYICYFTIIYIDFKIIINHTS